jgi:hypothetical protein
MTCAECKDFTYEVGSGRFPTCACFQPIPTPVEVDRLNQNTWASEVNKYRLCLVTAMRRGQTQVVLNAFMTTAKADRIVAAMAQEFDAAGWRLYHTNTNLVVVPK